MAPTDERFKRLTTDPRFRRPKQKHLKAEIDERFKDVLSEDFGSVASKAKVDKRGRALTSTSGADSMKRFYRLASPDEKRIDYARGEAELESSGSEDEESEVEEDELEIGGKRKVHYHQLDESESEEEQEEEDSDAEGQLRVNLDEDEELAEEDDEDESDEEGVDPTTRIAAVNLDWDNLRAADIFTIFNSFVKAPPHKKGEPAPPPPGRLLSVKIYPSEFGKERMAQEDAAGPGGGLWKVTEKAAKAKKAKHGAESDSEDEFHHFKDESGDEEEGDEEEEKGEESGDEEHGDNEKELEDDGLDPELDDLEIMSDVNDGGDGEDIDMDQLRKYQLERLRYYYAIATFSNVAAAELVHDQLNGTEFERTANILDLSYVPEDMDFAEDEVHDECDKEIKGYKGNEFVTDALRHSKVKLTWDQDDPNRAKVTRRALTREEIEAEDFGNLVAGSDSESESEAESSAAAAEETGKKKSKKEKAKERKEKLRALLAQGDSDVWGKAGTAWQDELADIRGDKEAKKSKSKAKEDVEITFKPGLTGPAEEDNMTSLEKYQLRVKEKKRAKKDKLSAKAAGRADGDEVDKVAANDDFFGDDSGVSDDDAPVSVKGKDAKGKKGKEDKKGKKGKKASATEDEANVVHFDADAAGIVDDPTRHFDLKDLITAEKDAGKKRKRHRNKGKKELELGPDGFASSVDVADPRFAAIYNEPTFAIDPTHSKFTDTSVNREILKRAREQHAKGRGEGEGSEKGKGGEPKEKGLSELVESVKAKSRPRKRSRKH